MNDKYTPILDQLVLIAQLMEQLDLEYAMKVVGETEALGPIIYPTAYIKGGAKNLTEARRLIAAGLAFQRKINPLLAEARQRAHVKEG